MSPAPRRSTSTTPGSTGPGLAEHARIALAGAGLDLTAARELAESGEVPDGASPEATVVTSIREGWATLDVAVSLPLR